MVNPFLANLSTLQPLKKTENLPKVSWCFQGVKNGNGFNKSNKVELT